jgi:hypothetical protein
MKAPTSEKWRDANKPVKTFFGLSPTIFALFFPTVFYFHIWTLSLCFFVTIFLAFVGYKGITPLMALRWVRSQITLCEKRICPWWVR